MPSYPVAALLLLGALSATTTAMATPGAGSPHHRPYVARASSGSAPNVNTTKPPAWFLAGDSTTAVQSTGGGGWGQGFLSFVKSPAWGDDNGVNGATTVSFVEEGYWAEVIDEVQANKEDYEPFVTIQFGHNDQKAAANISLDEYQANLEDLASQVKAAGGTPILITPLTRRAFTSDGLTLNLVDQRQYTIYAAENTSTWWIDLNQASTQYVEAIGNASAQVYNLTPNDTTHLNDYGSVVFGRMVADLILGHVPEVGVDVDWVPDASGDTTSGYLAQYFTPNQTLSEDLWGGIPA